MCTVFVDPQTEPFKTQSANTTQILVLPYTTQTPKPPLPLPLDHCVTDYQCGVTN